jgi:hypothetical protein
LLQKVLTLQSEVCRVRKRENYTEVQVLTRIFAFSKNQGECLTHSLDFFHNFHS